MERLFNRHAAGAGLNVVNMLGRAGDVAVDDELFMVLELCEAFRRGTEGYFDITACSERAADTAAGYTLDAAAHTVRLHGAGALLDLGGFAKGYALERLRQRVAEAGVQQAVLNFGDSSITAIGHHPYGEWWPIGVEPDARRSSVAQEFRLRDSAMSVSGRGRGGEYHIFDPHSGERVVREETMVVEGRSALVCEVLSTGAVCRACGAPRGNNGPLRGIHGNGVALRRYGRMRGAPHRAAAAAEGYGQRIKIAIRWTERNF